MYNFVDIYTGIAVMVQRDQDQTFLGKCKAWVNMGAIIAANTYDFWEELQTVLTPFASITGQAQYFMPSNFDKFYRLYDFTNNRKLTMITREEYIDGNISTVAANTQATPQWATIYGVSAVNFIETGSFQVQAKSSSNQDNSGITVRVEGWLDAAQTIAGYTNIPLSTGTPTAYVTDPNNTVFYGITRVTKSSDTTGYITLADQANTPNILATIAPVDRESRYPILYLQQTPNGAYSYQGLYKRKIKKLVNDFDYPFTDIGDFLTLYGLGWAYMQEKETVPRAQITWQKANELLMQQIRNQQDKLGPDYQHKFVNKTGQGHRF